MGQDLWSDLVHRDSEFELVRDAQISKANCRSKVGLISFCEVRASSPSLKRGNLEFNYFFFGGAGDEAVAVLGLTGTSHATEAILTTTYGRQNLMRRLVSYLIVVPAFTALVGWEFFEFFRRKGRNDE